MNKDTRPTLPVRTGVKAGGIGTSPSRGDNHNQALVVRTGVKAGGIGTSPTRTDNHNQRLA